MKELISQRGVTARKYKQLFDKARKETGEIKFLVPQVKACGYPDSLVDHLSALLEVILSEVSAGANFYAQEIIKADPTEPNEGAIGAISKVKEEYDQSTKSLDEMLRDAKKKLFVDVKRFAQP